MKLLPLIKNILLQCCIFFFIFCIADLVYSYIKKETAQQVVDPNKGLHKQNQFGFYWLDSSINKGNYTFGSINFPIYTNEYGFRCSKMQSLTKDSIEYVFLGDSFTYGEGEWEESFVGIFEKKLKAQLFNCGVPSYSPSVYLYQYKKALFTGRLKQRHNVIICLDISDVQDESTRWVYPDSIIGNSDANGIVFPILRTGPTYKAQDKQVNQQTNKIGKEKGIKAFVSSNMLLTSYIYVAFKKVLYKKQLIAEEDEAFAANRYLNRSGLTHIPWNELDSADTMGYKPLGVLGGLKKIESSLMEIQKLAKRNNSKIYLVVYPWPAQLLSEQRVFNWEKHWSSFASDNGIHFINCFDEFRAQIKRGTNPKDFYIRQDIHFNKYGNEYVANAIMKSLK
ncbi:hypothetical protein [Sediminibacterium sp.]|uniref:hypothetical protein n=1 Tax=Sediminibacterium sp. TaxID=1917865 RepID=UPI002732CAE6|nr:hypothetical protein [Sediminibacterium sp.]MDP3392419.1 hypothetical protein [Sediminibacterium sp.]MDP3565685.1 hypothetical protein [Sediminibacterium sp.]